MGSARTQNITCEDTRRDLAMHDDEDTPGAPRERREKEYQDHHYHDDDDVPADDAPPGWLAERGIDHPQLSAANGRLVHASLTHFGRTGPRRPLNTPSTIRKQPTM